MYTETKLINIDEVSALVLDFGSHTTRAGYAGEDTPRVVCPSYYGYTDEPSSSSNGNGTGNGDGDSNGNGNGMDVDSAPAAEPIGSKGKRKYYVGEDGVGIWRPNMEVGNFTTDGIGKYLPCPGTVISPPDLELSTGSGFESHGLTLQ